MKTIATAGVLAAAVGAIALWCTTGCQSDPLSSPGPVASSAAMQNDEGGPGAPMPAGKEPATSATLQERYTWHDGEREQSAWLDPRVVVQWRHRESADRTALDLAGRWTVAWETRGSRVWQLPDDASAAELADAQELVTRRQQTESGLFLPGFRSEPRRVGHLTALTNRILVTLPDDWDEGAVQRWADRQSLHVARKQSGAGNTYLMRAETGGTQVLQRIASLRNEPDVRKAIPDWLRVALPGSR